MRHHRLKSQPADDAPGAHHVRNDVDRKARRICRGHGVSCRPLWIAAVVFAAILARTAVALAAFGSRIAGIVGDTPVVRSPVRRAALARVAGHGRSFPKRWARPDRKSTRMNTSNKSAISMASSDWKKTNPE